MAFQNIQWPIISIVLFPIIKLDFYVLSTLHCHISLTSSLLVLILCKYIWVCLDTYPGLYQWTRMRQHQIDDKINNRYFDDTHLQLSVCLCLLHLFHNIPVIVSSRYFQELLPLKKVMSMQKVKVRGHMGQNPTQPFSDCNSSLNSHMIMEWCKKLDGT